MVRMFVILVFGAEICKELIAPSDCRLSHRPIGIREGTQVCCAFLSMLQAFLRCGGDGE